MNEKHEIEKFDANAEIWAMSQGQPSELKAYDRIWIPKDVTPKKIDVVQNIDVAQKRCKHCGQLKPVIAFYKDKTSKDGYQRWCKDCLVAYNKINRKGEKQSEVLTKKECTHCHEVKNITEFNKDNSRATGYQSWCRECKRKNARKKKGKPEDFVKISDGSLPLISSGTKDKHSIRGNWNLFRSRGRSKTND